MPDAKRSARDAWPFVELTARSADGEAFGAALLDAGSTGAELVELDDDRVAVRAWFDDVPDLGDLARTISTAPGVDADAARAAAATIKAGATPTDDWLRKWKEGFEPITVGERLLVSPSWKRDAGDAFGDRLRIEIDPGMAFGTGTHETTRLCLEWLDANWRGGTLVDVGTGTGILAMAAALLAPVARPVAVDVDHVAIEVARENAANNGLLDRIAFEVGGPETVRGEYDVVLANLTADVISAVAKDLKRLARSGGRLVLSGILAEQGEWLTAELAALGLVLESTSRAGEWIALVLQRP